MMPGESPYDPHPTRSFGYRIGAYTAHRLTKAMRGRAAEVFPHWYVSEHPKSGGTWLAKMLACALDVACPQNPLLPPAMPAVIHNHWMPWQNMRRVVYLFRDGRDVMLSLYHHLMRALRASPSAPDIRRRRRALEGYLGSAFDPTAVKQNLPGFISYAMEHPYGCRHNWARHLDRWLATEAILVSYESLRSDPVAELTRILVALGETSISSKVVELVCQRYDFSVMTDGINASERHGSFLRRGQPGEWREVYSADALDRFAKHCGRTQILAGYSD